MNGNKEMSAYLKKTLPTVVEMNGYPCIAAISVYKTVHRRSKLNPEQIYKRCRKNPVKILSKRVINAIARKLKLNDQSL